MSLAERLVMARASTQTVTTWETHYPVSGRGLYRCPGYGEGSYEGGQVGPEYNGYGINYRAAFSNSGTTIGEGSANPAIEYWMKIQRMKKEKILMADGFQHIQSNPASSQFGVYWKRHNKGAKPVRRLARRMEPRIPQGKRGRPGEALVHPARQPR